MPHTSSTFFSRSKHSLKSNHINNRLVRKTHTLKQRDSNASFNKQAIMPNATQHMIDELVHIQTMNSLIFRSAFTPINVNKLEHHIDSPLNNTDSSSALLIMTIYISLNLIIPGLVKNLMPDYADKNLDISTSLAP